MKVPRNQVATAISHLAASQPEPELAKSVAAYLLSENRTGELDSIMRDLIAVRADTGTVEVAAVSARPLEAGTLEAVRSEIKRIYPGAKTIIVSPRIDETLLGGVRLEFPQRQLDLSLRAKLNRLKQSITYRKDPISA